jgi:betaine-aldehyde dehydrogenase
MFIDGQPVDSNDVFEIVDPATEEVFGTVARGGTEHADRAVEAAKRAHERGEWRGKAPAERAAVMDAIVAELTARMPELVELEVGESGGTVRQATAFHIGTAIAHLQYFADLARTYEFVVSGPPMTEPTVAQGIVRREPLGVCVAIAPWNTPLIQAVWKLGPALAAGNTCVVKPDEKTPFTTIELARVAHECGLPDGVLNVVTGTGEEVGAHLCSHPDVAKVTFTGSTEVGREVMRRASETLKRVTLELGGKSASIVLEDADLDVAVDAALFGCFTLAGQMCESSTRLLVPESLHDEIVERMVRRTAAIKVGDPRDPATDVGPLVSATQRERVLGYIELAKQEGATIACGGGAPAGEQFEKGFYVEPTILTDVTNDMRVAREEIFGPVLAVIPYATVDDAVAIANDSPYGLAAGVFGSDTQQLLDIAARLESGTVWLNDWHMVDPQYPFGGCKQSGIGRELGPRALDPYTDEKFVRVDQSGRLDRRIYGLLLSEPLTPAA